MQKNLCASLGAKKEIMRLTVLENQHGLLQAVVTGERGRAHPPQLPSSPCLCNCSLKEVILRGFCGRRGW